MNRDRCQACPHRAYFHEETDPPGRCQLEGCDCQQFVPPGDTQLTLMTAPAWRMRGWTYDIEETA